jgi:hypothetical protein
MKLLHLLGLALCFSTAFAEPVPPQKSAGFVRSLERADKSTACETLCAEYLPASGTGPAVWLIGVAHLGSPGYYREIQQRLDGHNVVLYEGVGLGEAVKQGPIAGTRDAGVQAGLARALGLVFQLDAIDYRRPHFLNSDVRPAELAAQAEKRTAAHPERKSEDLIGPLMDALQGTGAIGTMMNNVIGVLGKSPEMQEMTKAVLVEALGNAGELLDLARTASPELRDLFEVLLTERNAIVLADLRAQLAKRRPGETIAIFYGAAHMDEIAASLRTDLGYVPAKQEWLPAFTADPAKGGTNPLQLRFMIEMAKMQLRALQSPAKK